MSVVIRDHSAIVLRTINNYNGEENATAARWRGYAPTLDYWASPVARAAQVGACSVWSSWAGSSPKERFVAVWISTSLGWACAPEKEGFLVRDIKACESGSYKSFYPGVLGTVEAVTHVAVLITKKARLREDAKDWNANEFLVYCDMILRPISGAVPVLAIKQHPLRVGEISQFTCIQKLYTGSLLSVFSNFAELSPKTRYKFMRLILKCVSEVHTKRIHQDIKPDNFFVLIRPPEGLKHLEIMSPDVLNDERTEVEICLGDLAFSVPIDPKIRSNKVVGTPNFFSPEIAKIKCSLWLDPSIDFEPSIKLDSFATGLVLLWMYDRKMFFEWKNSLTGGSFEELCQKLCDYHATEKPNFFSHLLKTPVGGVIEKLLDPSAEARITAQEALELFSQIDH